MIDIDSYTLFDEFDFQNVIGEQLAEKLQDRATNDLSTYFIAYVSNLISYHIQENTSLMLYKEYEPSTPNDYKGVLALAKKKDGTYVLPRYLSEEQIEMLKLACVYQADYLIDNGSTERMTAMGMVNRSNKYDKKDLKEFEICSISHSLLARAGLLYRGIGGTRYA